MSWVNNSEVNPTLQPIPQQLFFLNLPLLEEKIPLKCQTSEEIAPIGEGIRINLTAQQLLAAGYQVSKKPWNESEDQRLIDLYKHTDLSWKEISQKMPGRTSKMCYSRYRRIQNRLKEQWTHRQNTKIQGLVGLFGEKWERISQFFPNRNPKQIQDHYMNYLRPEINKEPWTFEEDLLLIQLLEKYGKNWSLIEKCMNGRTQSQIKNRYFGRLKRMEEKKEKKQEKESKQASEK